MKTVIFALFVGLIGRAKADTIAFYIEKKPSVSAKQISRVFFERFLPELHSSKESVFQNAKIEVLQQSSRGGIKGKAVRNANSLRTSDGIKKLKQKEDLREIAKQYNITVDERTADYIHPEVPALEFYVSIEISTDVTEEQTGAVAKLKATLDSVAVVSASVSKTYVIFDHNNTQPDEKNRMAFLVPWKPGADPRATQGDWLNRHGPLAQNLISKIKNHETLIKRYVQVHTALEQPNEIFDSRYQGICFENVPSINRLLWAKLTDKNVDLTSELLALDEETLSQGPSVILMKRVE